MGGNRGAAHCPLTKDANEGERGGSGRLPDAGRKTTRVSQQFTRETLRHPENRKKEEINKIILKFQKAR